MYHVPFSYPEYAYDQALIKLKESLKFGISPMLESVEDMLKVALNPDLHFKSIQIAGTNGKTSSSRFTAALLRAQGYRVGLYTSPELMQYPERIEIDGKVISRELFAQGLSAAFEAGNLVNSNRQAAGLDPYDITEFDLLTVAALIIFAQEGVEAAVLECGMGGRWDATSAAGNITTVGITGIGLDHMRILGDTPAAIAHEKAAIIKQGRTCVLGEGTLFDPSVRNVFFEQAKKAQTSPICVCEAARASELLHELDCAGIQNVHTTYTINRTPARVGGSLVETVVTPCATYPELGVLKPLYQAPNLAFALTLAEAFCGHAIDYETAYEALVHCPTPGRFDVVQADPLILVDACHNPQSVEAFLASFEDMFPNPDARPALLFAALADKDVDTMCTLVSQVFPKVYLTQTQSSRALAVAELAQKMRAAGVCVSATYPNVTQALDALKGAPLVSFGSITLAGEVARYFRDVL